jgi:F-type H+-transporting ATPase subunit delta
MLAKVVAEKLSQEPRQAAKIAKSLAAYLVANKMTGQLEMLLGDIAYELAREKRHVYATVTTARKLDAGLKEQITRFLAKEFDTKNIELVADIDPSLIGGAVITAPEVQLDASVRNKLRRLRQA